MSRHLSAEEWVTGLNRLVLKHDLPISLQGGEPTLHHGFYDIVNGVNPEANIDLLTNLQFKVKEFQSRISPGRIRREAPYASIRVSYHPQVMNLERTMEKVLAMQEQGYSIGLFGVLHPDQEDVILAAQEKCRGAGIDFRTKEFLGFHEGRLHGHYLYPEAVMGEKHEPVMCRNSEMLIDPSGFVFRCHHDVYHGLNPIGHILDADLMMERKFRSCQFFGKCNPCDIKMKNNRFQQFGHCSVEILGRPAETGSEEVEKIERTVSV
jgi:MoaA/NifB/PqqE/SkfB family radical SAM enzyme